MTGNGAKLDWLSFTFESSLLNPEDSLFEVKRILTKAIGTPVVATSKNGLHGFTHSVTFYAWNQDCEETPLGVMAWGGSNQKGRIYVDLNGFCCSSIADFSDIHSFCETLDARITRIDLCVDDLHGEFLDMDRCEYWYHSGEFTNGGNRPSYSVAGDWLGDQGAGRTFYVGKRKNGKICRLYEKGKQLGDRNSKWVRMEVEIRNRDRQIPLETIVNPSPYFVGSYPLAHQVIQFAAKRIRTIKTSAKISAEHLIKYGRIAYGKLLYTLHKAGLEAEEIFHTLVETGTPRRLLDIPKGILNSGSLRDSYYGNH